MIWIILATGFGAANFIAIALLFRRMRHTLNRQLSDMRAERNSEWILDALHGAPEQRERPAQAAGSGSHVLPLHPRPVRRKKHLGLYEGGGAIAAAVVTLSAIIRCGRESHGAHIVSTALGTTALAATTITVMTVTPWQQDIETVPPPASTATMTQPPGHDSTSAAPAADSPPPQRPPASTGTRDGSLQTPAAEGSTSPTAAPSRGAAASTSAQPRPADTSSPTTTPTPDATAAGSGTCVDIRVLGAHACLTGGR